jgi:hypothetical protein
MAGHVCSFCGDKGHAAVACPIQNKVKNNDSGMGEVRVSRSRTRKAMVKSFDEIMFDHHMVAQPGFEKDIDAYVKENFSFRGMVDMDAFAASVFNPNNFYNMADMGHRKVLGYAVEKYCDVSNDYVKEFLRNVCKEFPTSYCDIMRNDFGAICVQKGTALHFRKYTGRFV